MNNSIDELKSKIKRRYKNGPDKIGRDLIAPCLRNSKLYRRGTGFFSSGALVAYAEAMDHLISDKTKIQIICSPVVHDQELVRTLNNNLTVEQKNKTINDLTDNIVLEAIGYRLDSKRRDYKNHLLAYLIAKGILEIRFAVPLNFGKIDFDQEASLTNNLYHVKTGYFCLTDESVVAFDGSFNESDAGHQHHVDQTQVWRSWEEKDQERLQDTIQDIDSDWEGTNKYIQVFKMSATALNLVGEFSSSQRPQRASSLKQTTVNEEVTVYKVNSNGLRDYQEKALINWKDAGNKGIIAMATGTGKTRTAIEAINRFMAKTNRGLVVITVPYQPLANQWVEELGKKGLSVIKVFDSLDSWENRVQNLIQSHLVNSSTKSNLPILVCVNKSFKAIPFQLLLARLNGKRGDRLLIVDECHHFNKTKQITKLSDAFPFRLGLSATPYEADEPKILEKYFGEIIFEYTIAQAIADGYLCKYSYHPILIEFTEDEVQRFIATAKKIQTSAGSEDDDSDLISNVGAYDELDRILETVIGKLAKLEEVLRSKKNKKFSLFYCGTGYIQFDGEERIRQVDSLTRLLDKINWRVGRITSEETQNSRQATFNDLRKGEIDAIASIRVLDEGIDIPDCRQAYILASQRSERQGIQRRGRILRISSGKEIAELYDFIMTGPKLSDVELERLYSRELKRARLFSSDAINKEECLSILSGI